VAETKREREAFYLRNAKKGRTVRFTIDMDFGFVSEEDRAKYDIVLGGLKIGRGTLTPEQAKRVLDVVLGS